jgi:hypothetical protein
LAESAQTIGEPVRRSRLEQPDYWHRRLLRVRSERPRSRRAAEKRHKVASLHCLSEAYDHVVLLRPSKQETTVDETGGSGQCALQKFRPPMSQMGQKLRIDAPDDFASCPLCL